MVEYFPRTCEPVPAVLTEHEAIRYLRLDEEGRDPDAAQRALRRLVETRRIRPCRIGIRNRFARAELHRFVLHATEIGDSVQAPQRLGEMT